MLYVPCAPVAPTVMLKVKTSSKEVLFVVLLTVLAGAPCAAFRSNPVDPSAHDSVDVSRR